MHGLDAPINLLMAEQHLLCSVSASLLVEYCIFINLLSVAISRRYIVIASEH